MLLGLIIVFFVLGLVLLELVVVFLILVIVLLPLVVLLVSLLMLLGSIVVILVVLVLIVMLPALLEGCVVCGGGKPTVIGSKLLIVRLWLLVVGLTHGNGVMF